MVKYDLEDDRSWHSARTICIGLGGDLASLETPKLILAAEAIRQVSILNGGVFKMQMGQSVDAFLIVLQCLAKS